MKTVYFHKTKQVVKTEIVRLSKQEIIDILIEKKPTEIWCNEWSSKKPFIRIRYLIGNNIEVSCEGLADTSFKATTIHDLYEKHSMYWDTGFSFKERDEDDAWNDFRAGAYDAWKKKEDEKFNRQTK